MKNNLWKILCMAPLAVFLCVFTLLPILRTIGLSFHSMHHPGITLRTYGELLGEPAFRRAFINTLLIAGFSLGIELAFGLTLALLTSHRSRLNAWMRPLFILPLAVPTTVVGVIMSYLFSSSGWLNRILSDLRIIGKPVHWMSGGMESIIMVTAADCWKVTPLVMLILLAGLQSIDRSLYRAARIDGAGTLCIFRRITLPLLIPSITVAVVIRGIDAFRIFALPLILMGQNLKVLGTYAYLEYAEFNNVHTSAASAVILLALIMSGVAAYTHLAGRGTR